MALCDQGAAIASRHIAVWGFLGSDGICPRFGLPRDRSFRLLLVDAADGLQELRGCSAQADNQYRDALEAPVGTDGGDPGRHDRAFEPGQRGKKRRCGEDRHWQPPRSGRTVSTIPASTATVSKLSRLERLRSRGWVPSLLLIAPNSYRIPTKITGAEGVVEITP